MATWKQLFATNTSVLFIVIFLGSLASSLTLSFWPSYIRALGATVAEVGFVFAVSNSIMALVPLISGPISDKYGALRTNILGSFLAVFPPLLYFFAFSWTDLIPSVALAGLATGLYTPCRWSMIASFSTKESRAAVYAWMNIALLSGPAIAPLLGGLVADAIGMRVAFAPCFALIAFSFIFSLKLKKDHLVQTEPIPARSDSPRSFLLVLSIFAFLNLAQGVAFGITSPVTPLFLRNRFGIDFTIIGVIQAVGFGFSSVMVQIPGGKMARIYGKRRTLFFTTLVSAPFFSLFALSRNPVEATILMFISNALLNLSWPSYCALTMDLTSPGKWGFVNGLMASSLWGGMAVGSTFAGVIWENFGMSFPYYIEGLLVLVSALPVILLSVRRERKNAQILSDSVESKA